MIDGGVTWGVLVVLGAAAFAGLVAIFVWASTRGTRR